MTPLEVTAWAYYLVNAVLWGRLLVGPGSGYRMSPRAATVVGVFWFIAVPVLVLVGIMNEDKD